MLRAVVAAAAVAAVAAAAAEPAAAAAAASTGSLAGSSRLIAPAAALIAFTVLLALKKRLSKVWYLEKIPGPPSLPLIGNVLDIRGSHRDLFNAMQRFCTYGRGVCRLYLGLQPYCLLYRAQSVETMLSSNFQMDKSSDYNFLHPWMGTGLLTAKGDKWRARRKLLTPSFHFKILEEFIAVMNHRAARLVAKMEANVDGGDFDVAPMATLCTLDIIIGAVMGCDMDVQTNSDCEYVKAVKGMGEMVHTRQSSPWLHSNFLFSVLGYAREQAGYVKVLHGMAYSAIKQRRAQQLQQQQEPQQPETNQALGQKRRLAFLDLLLEQANTPDGASFTDEDIREEVDTFMFAGHDTTASAVTFLLYLLAKHPKIQQSVYEELCDVTGNDFEGLLDLSRLRELNLLERCIKESLRIFPPVPFFARHLLCTKVFDNYVIPGGTTVMVNAYALHRDPEQFPDPERFDPDRFLPEACAARHPYAYVPFSAGHRNCIGQKFAMMEQKVVIGSVLNKFRLSTTQEPEQMHLKGELVLQSENGVHIAVTRRCETTATIDGSNGDHFTTRSH